MLHCTANEQFSDGEGHVKGTSTSNWEFRNSLKNYILIVKQTMWIFFEGSVWLSSSESRACLQLHSPLFKISHSTYKWKFDVVLSWLFKN